MKLSFEQFLAEKKQEGVYALNSAFYQLGKRLEILPESGFSLALGTNMDAVMDTNDIVYAISMDYEFQSMLEQLNVRLEPSLERIYEKFESDETYICDAVEILSGNSIYHTDIFFDNLQVNGVLYTSFWMDMTKLRKVQ